MLHTPSIHCAALAGAALITCLAARLEAAENDSSWDHLVLVDVAQKSYRIRVDEPGYERWDERGTFDSSLVVSPTLRVRAPTSQREPSVMMILGLSYGRFVDHDLKVDSIEWQIGAGAWWPLNEWSDFSLHAQVGTGTTYVDLPEEVNRSSGRSDAWEPTMHAGVMAILAFHPHRHVTIAFSGGARVLYQRAELEDGSQVTFSNVISGGMLGGGIGLTF